MSRKIEFCGGSASKSLELTSLRAAAKLDVIDSGEIWLTFCKGARDEGRIHRSIPESTRGAFRLC